MPYRLVSDQLSGDTVEALETLLRHARQGEIIGVAFCAMYRRKEYIVNTAGEARRSPTFASGMVEQLQRFVSQRTRSPSP